MKNKYLILGLAFVSIVGSLSSCKKDVDVTSTCKDIAQKTILGDSKIRSGSQVNDGLQFVIVQYQFQDGNKATRTVVNWGNKKAMEKTTQKLSYTMGDFGENGVGVNVLFTPDDPSASPFSCYFMNNEITEKGTGLQFSLASVDDKVAAIGSAETNFNDVRCGLERMEYWKDTVKYYDTTFSERIIKVDGKKVIVVDTIVKEKQRIDTLFLKTYLENKFEFYRNAGTLENTGLYSHISKEWKKDSTVVVDTVSSYKFHWCFSAISSAKKFSVRIISDDSKIKEDWNAEISKFDPAKQTISIDGEAYEFSKPE